MKVQSTAQNKRRQDRLSRVKYTSAGAGTLGGIAVAASTLAKKSLIPEFLAPSKNLSKEELSRFHVGVKLILKDTGLEKTGLKIVRLTPKNYFDKFKSERASIKPGSFTDKLTKIINEAQPWNQIIKGKNAMHSGSKNKVYIPEKGLDLAILHELGHACNRHFSKTFGLIRKMKKLKFISPAIIIIALFAKTKNKKRKNNIFNKITHFIKYNAGKIILLAMAPTLIEEAMASIRAKRFARKYLTPQLAQKVVRGNRFGYSTYLLTALTLSLGTAAAVKVEDLIAKPKTLDK